MRERSLLSRFAGSRPTQATEVDDTHGLGAARPRRPHRRRGHQRRRPTTACATSPRAPAPPRARRRRAAGEPGDYPGLPAPAPARPHDGFDPPPPQLDPARGRRGAARRVRALRGRRAAGVRDLDRGRRRDRDRLVDRRARADAVTDAYMKVIARDERGRSGLGGAAPAVARRRVDPAALARRARRPRSRREEPVELAPGEYPVVLEPDAVGSLLDFLGCLAFNGLAHAEGRGALVGPPGRSAWRRRRSTSPTRRASPARCRARSTPRACPRRRCRSSRTASPTRSCTTRARPRVRARRSTGHALAPGGSAYGPAPDEPRAHRRRRGRRGRARRADRARALRDAPVVRQRRPREVHAS